MALTKNEQLAKSLIWESLNNVAFATLQVQMPFLAWPFVSQIAKYFFDKYSDNMFDNFATMINVNDIKLKIEDQQTAYVAAMDALTKAKETNDVQAAQKAKDDFHKALFGLIQFKSN